MILKVWSRADPWAYRLMRVVFGLLFAFHGFQKLFGLFGGTRMPLASRMGAAGVIESVGGLLIAAGIAVTPVAFIASGEMAAAYFLSHAPRGLLPIQNSGELTVLYCFAFLYMSVRGK